MRKLLTLIAGAGLALAIAAPVVVGDSDQEFRASLNGYLEVPSISTTARGSFFAEVKGSTLRYRLTYSDLGSDSLFAHIHFARPDVIGGVVGVPVRWRRQAGVPAQRRDGEWRDRCGRRRGTGRQGHRPGELAELVRAMRNGATYVNVHSQTYPPGEIRGNIRRT